MATNIFCCKKSMTSIVAVILIVMITIAAAGTMFFWLSRIQGQGQGSVEGSEAVLLERMATCVDIAEITLNIFNNSTRLAIQNCGSNSVKIGDGDDKILVSSTDSCAFILTCSMVTSSTCPMTLLPGALGRIDFNTRLAACSGLPSTLADVMADQAGLSHQIIISVDKKATASRGFIPENIDES